MATPSYLDFGPFFSGFLVRGPGAGGLPGPDPDPDPDPDLPDGFAYVVHAGEIVSRNGVPIIVEII